MVKTTIFIVLLTLAIVSSTSTDRSQGKPTLSTASFSSFFNLKRPMLLSTLMEDQWFADFTLINLICRDVYDVCLEIRDDDPKAASEKCLSYFEKCTIKQCQEFSMQLVTTKRREALKLCRSYTTAVTYPNGNYSDERYSSLFDSEGEENYFSSAQNQFTDEINKLKKQILQIKKQKDAQKNYTNCTIQKSKLQGQMAELKEQNIRLEKMIDNNIRPPKPENVPSSPMAYNFSNLVIASRVLQMKGTMYTDMKFISESLKNPKGFQLLYRASQDGFGAEEFHKHCDNISDTFVLIRTEFGRTIAGYTHYKWNQVKNGFVYDSARKTFLLQLDLRQKLDPIRDSCLIYCHQNYGPTFGSYDLEIKGNNNSYSNSYSQIGDTYNINEANKYVLGSQQSYSAMGGNPTGQYFKVVEIEVFRVVFENN